MYLRYSLRVVAPIQRSAPLAKAGFNIFEASIAPSAAPAPTNVCNSSIKRTTSPWAASISFKTAFSLSSNSPRNLVPATKLPKSKAIIRFFFKPSGTSACAILWANPSIIAVLPTPGSPIKTGLFFVRRRITWITRRISSSRPITGSSFPRLASSVKLRPNFSKGLNLDSGFISVTL